ncbi:MAG TPA: hypothetical protein VGK67_02615 [Myxococcales bacterium]|jgi:hypothetical protein
MTRTLLFAVLVGFLGSCLEPVDQLTSDSEAIDERGGSLTGPGGAHLVIPAGALGQPVRVTMLASAWAPSGVAVAGSAVLIQPTSASLKKPARLTLPIHSSAAGSSFAVATRSGTGAIEILQGTTDGDSVDVQISHFGSFMPVMAPPADAGLPGLDAGEESEDAGMPLAGRDAGGVWAPSDAAVVPDAGVFPDAATAADAATVVECEPSPDGGTLYFNGLASGGSGCSSKAADGTNRYYLTCTSSDCTCERNPFDSDAWSQVIPAPPDVCTDDGFKRTWACGCGFPMLVVPGQCQPVPDPNVPPGAKRPFGAECTTAEDCESGLCFNSGQWRCNLNCDPDLIPACPCGYHCADWTGGVYGAPSYACFGG